MNITTSPATQRATQLVLTICLVLATLAVMAPTPATARAIGNPTALTPSSKITTERPTFTFRSNTKIDVGYSLEVFDAAGNEIADERFTLSDASCTRWGLCTAPVDIVLDNGDFSWSIQRTLVRHGNPLDFSVGGVDFTSPEPIAPVDTVETPGVTRFEWTRVEGAVEYVLTITDTDGTTSHELSAAATGCSTSGDCWRKVEIAAGDVEWSVDAVALDGSTVSSETIEFESSDTVADPDPEPEQDPEPEPEETVVLDAATPLAPSGLSTDDTPTFVWTEVDGATAYQITVLDEDDRTALTLYATNGDCTGGECEVDGSALANGGYRFTVYATDGLTADSTSEALDFAIGQSLPAPVIVSPSIDSGNGQVAAGTNSFTWEPSEGAELYLVALNPTTGTAQTFNVTPAAAGCEGAVGQCTLSATVTDSGYHYFHITASPDTNPQLTDADSSDYELFIVE